MSKSDREPRGNQDSNFAFLEASSSGHIVRTSRNLWRLVGSGTAIDELRPGTSLIDFANVGSVAAGAVFEAMAADLTDQQEELRRELDVGDRVLECVHFAPSRADASHLWLLRDVTTERAEHERLRFQSEVLARVSDAVLTVDAKMAISYWNPGAEILIGVKADAAVGRGPDDLFQFRFPTPEEEHLAWATVGETGRWSGELIIRPIGSDRDHSVTASVATIYDEQDRFQGLLAVVRDDTERREMEARLRHHALHDNLTGLPSRMMMLSELDRVVSDRHRAGPTRAVLYVDIDRFKRVNDSLGHHAGDALLSLIGSRIAACLRETDVVGRIGGDEFAVLLNNAGGIDHVHQAASRVLASIAVPVEIDGERFQTSASIGVVIVTPECESAEELLRDADTAMYEAKRSGRARVSVFDRNTPRDAVDRFHLESDLRQAFSRNELRAFFQPIVDLNRGRLAGFEALVRWEHASSGVIGPDLFLSVAEESDLIVQLDRWMWDAAIRTQARWIRTVPNARDLTMSVNCSERSLRQSDLSLFVGSLLEKHSVPADRVMIEITENIAIDGSTAHASMLEELRRLGIRIALDDVGTGHATLSVLHALPVDVLKIDRSFAGRMERRIEGMETVRTLVALARSIGLECVAEGIATRRQATDLRAMGCPLGQGYFFSAPIASEAAVDLITWSGDWLAGVDRRRLIGTPDRAWGA